MLLRIFRSQLPIHYFLIPLITLLLWFRAISGEIAVSVSGGTMPLFLFLERIFHEVPLWVSTLTALILVVVQAFYLNYLVNRFEILYKPSYVPALMYVLLMSFSKGALWMHPVIWINFLLIASFHKVFLLFKNPNPIRLLFDAGFLIGLAFLVHPSAIIFFALLMLSLSMIRTLNLREWLIVLIGLVLPFYFACIWYYWNDGLGDFLKSIFSNVPNFRFHHNLHWALAQRAEGVLILLLTVMSLVKLRKHFYKNTIRTRINQRVLIYTIFAAIAALLLVPIIQWYDFTLFAFPFAVFIGYYFHGFKKRMWLGELLFTLLAATVIWNLF